MECEQSMLIQAMCTVIETSHTYVNIRSTSAPMDKLHRARALRNVLSEFLETWDSIEEHRLQEPKMRMEGVDVDDFVRQWFEASGRNHLNADEAVDLLIHATTPEEE